VSSVAYSKWSPEKRQIRFTGNVDHIREESKLTGIALSYGVSLDRAIVLVGPNARQHQYAFSEWDELILVEIIEDVYRQAYESAVGMNRYWAKKLGCYTFQGMPNKRTPLKTRLFLGCIFKVFYSNPSFGLFDFDGCQTPSEKLVEQLSSIVRDNTIGVRWALRTTICTRKPGSRDNVMKFVRAIEEQLPLSPYKKIRLDVKTFREGGKGAPMAMIQWILDPK
jgi:hypothetical protein